LVADGHGGDESCRRDPASRERDGADYRLAGDAQSDMYGPVAAARLAELAGAVEGIDDPDALVIGSNSARPQSHSRGAESEPTT